MHLGIDDLDGQQLATRVSVRCTESRKVVLAATVREHTQAVKDALAAWHASYDYYNFEETPAAASAVLPPASYHRLQKIKASYDPDQAIISAHPVRLLT